MFITSMSLALGGKVLGVLPASQNGSPGNLGAGQRPTECHILLLAGGAYNLKNKPVSTACTISLLTLGVLLIHKKAAEQLISQFSAGDHSKP